MNTFRGTAPILLAILATVSCGDRPTPLESPAGIAPEFSSAGRVIHRASLGGEDYCEAIGRPTGCDANFSLIALEYEDGTVSGQWQDTFGDEGEGIHVAIDCLHVVGNVAVIGGVITHGTAYGRDAAGERALTAVVDNGTSANDPPDQLSWSYHPAGDRDCHDYSPGMGVLPLFNLTHGQVTVW